MGHGKKEQRAVYVSTERLLLDADCIRTDDNVLKVDEQRFAALNCLAVGLPVYYCSQAPYDGDGTTCAHRSERCN